MQCIRICSAAFPLRIGFAVLIRQVIQRIVEHPAQLFKDLLVVVQGFTH